MKKRLIIFILVPFFLFSQEWNERASSGEGLVGISLGLLINGQTKYPNPYIGPEVNALHNDGAYHFILDIYFNKFIFGFQLSDEFLYLEKFSNDGVWKPRGFNDSFSSLTRGYWLTLGYNIISNFNIKLGVGYRIGPIRQFINRDYSAENVAEGFNYLSPEIIFNNSTELNKFSEIDYSLSITYPFKVYGEFGIVPELGYTIKHGGLLTGISIIY